MARFADFGVIHLPPDAPPVLRAFATEARGVCYLEEARRLSEVRSL